MRRDKRGADQPLGLIRVNYSDALAYPTVIFPHSAWGGGYAKGSFPAGEPCVLLYTGTRLRPDLPSGGTNDGEIAVGEPNRQDTSYVEHCMQAEWPAHFAYSTHELRPRSTVGPVSWMGSLIQGSRDVSGLMYMRNRYYDPASGRFTQEDPIGIAGGLNVYGFANGDPVSYSDPYGLDPCKESPAWTDCIAIALANWGARNGSSAALFAGAATSALLEATGLNAAATAGDRIGNGRVIEGGAQAGILIGGGIVAQRLGRFATRLLSRGSAGRAATAIAQSMDDVVSNPSILRTGSGEVSPDDVAPIARASGWVETVGTRGAHKDQVRAFREWQMVSTLGE